MNRQTFLESLGHIADAPGGIDKLRSMILDLAMKGALSGPATGDRAARLVVSEAQQTRPQWTDPTAPPGFSRKDAGFPLGESPLPSSWTYSRLGEILQLVNGRAYKKSEWKNVGIPVIRIQNLNGGRDYYFSDLELRPHNYCERGDLLFAWSASFGPYIWSGDKAIFHYHIWKVVTSPALVKRFGYYLLDAMTAAVKSASHGLAMLHMTKETMEGLVCPVPPVAEQHRIVERVEDLMGLCDNLEQRQADRTDARLALTASTLSRVSEAESVDDLRARVRAFADTIGLHLAPGEGDLAALNLVRRTILDLAVRGRLTRQDPDDEPAAQLVKRVKASRGELPRQRWQQRSTPSPLPGAANVPFRLPDTWQWNRLDEICESRLGKMLDDRKNTGVSRPYLRNTNVQWGRFNLDEIKEIRLEDSELEEYSLRDGDLLVVEGGEPARCAIWDSSLADGGMVFQKALHRVRPREGVSASYISFVLRNGVDSGRIAELFTGSTIKHLTGEKLKGFLIPLPPTPEQHRIVDRVAELFALCDDLEGQLSAASSLRGDLAASVVAHAVSGPPAPGNEADTPLVASAV